MTTLRCRQDARDIGALWQQMYRSQYFEGGRVLTAAISAIDIALHDAVARSLGVPVYQLLGGKHRQRVPLFVTSFAPMGQGLVDDVKRLADEGWDCIRVASYGDMSAPALCYPQYCPLLCSPQLAWLQAGAGGGGGDADGDL